MSVSISFREVEGVSTVTVSGRITANDGEGSLRRYFGTLVQQGSKGYFFELENLEYVDGVGFKELITILFQLRKRGDEVRILNPSAQLRFVSHMPGMDQFLQFFKEELLLPIT